MQCTALLDAGNVHEQRVYLMTSVGLFQ